MGSKHPETSSRTGLGLADVSSPKCCGSRGFVWEAQHSHPQARHCRGEQSGEKQL